MKHAMNERRQSSGVCPEGMKERRKAYYHGKYHKRMLSLLLVVTCVAVVLLRQGI